MTTQTLINKYRPQEWDEVIGQDAVVRSLKDAVENGRSQTFLLTGDSGCGKTTLARIAAAKLDCDVFDYDAAKHTGVDDVRAIMEPLEYQPLNSRGLALVIDECHLLSKQAWSSMLKTTEEPPPWVFWFFCTTEPGKVPKNIQTRCAAYQLKPVGVNHISAMLANIVGAERAKTPTAVVKACAQAAGGSPRQAIANLSKCLTAKTAEEANDLLDQAQVEQAGVDLARHLYRHPQWKECQRILAGLPEGTNAEGVRQVVRAYGTKVVLGAKSINDAGFALEVLDAFSTYMPPQEGLTPLLLACGRLTLGNKESCDGPTDHN